ncbi:MAG: hypothetical protein MUE98_09490 [Rhodobacteraceae bacterium]|jgi:hypothetical protein|nr:hypothetical protein [Paracoccaceae bacterium]
MRVLHGTLAIEMVLAGLRATLMIVILYALAIVLFVERPLAAYLCPTCAGLTEVAPGIYLDDPAATRRTLMMLEAAERRVARVFGKGDSRPVVLVCRTAECEARVGGLWQAPHTLGVAYGWSFVRLSPRGFSEDVLAHELTHIEIHRRIGLIAIATGRLPAWWNEGMATIVASGRPTSCPRAPGALPGTPLEWRRTTGVLPGRLYLLAACRTRDWLDRNGGMQGALAMLDDLGDGASFRP